MVEHDLRKIENVMLRQEMAGNLTKKEIKEIVGVIARERESNGDTMKKWIEEGNFGKPY